MDKNVSTTPYNLYYEARTFSEHTIQQNENGVISDQVDGLPDGFSRVVTSIKAHETAKKKTVYCYLSPKVTVLLCPFYLLFLSF